MGFLSTREPSGPKVKLTVYSGKYTLLPPNGTVNVLKNAFLVPAYGTAHTFDWTL